MKLVSILLIAFSFAACNSPSNTTQQNGHMKNGCGCCKKCVTTKAKPQTCKSCPRSGKCTKCESKPAPAQTPCKSCPRSGKCTKCETKPAPAKSKTCRSCSGSTNGCSKCPK